MFRYQVGGGLASDAPSYAVRKADAEIFEALLSMEYGYVLNSRQMGKSSLQNRTMARLEREGYVCASINLNNVGNRNITPDQWVNGLILRLKDKVGMSRAEINAWLRERENTPHIQRFCEYIDAVLLERIQGNLVIFIDEIDSALALDFPPDNFFVALHNFYEYRSSEPKYRRLAFVLLGVADPYDFATDKLRTPFHSSRMIELTGFTLDEAKQALLPGLALVAENPASVLKAALEWTGGQPFLTQRVCDLLAGFSSTIGSGTEAEQVGKAIQTGIVQDWESTDRPPHFRTIRDRLLLSAQGRTGQMLGIYREILRQGSVSYDGSPEQLELRLTGLVRETSGKLQVYNRIYASIFDADWVKEQLDDIRPYSTNLNRWLESNRTAKDSLPTGDELRDHLIWASTKRLSPEDYEFFAACQEKSNAIQLEIERKSREEATSRERKANLRIAVGSVILIGLSLLSAGIIAYTTKKVNEAGQKLRDTTTQLKKTEILLKTSVRDLKDLNQKYTLQEKTSKLQFEQAKSRYDHEKQRLASDLDVVRSRTDSLKLAVKATEELHQQKAVNSLKLSVLAASRSKTPEALKALKEALGAVFELSNHDNHVFVVDSTGTKFALTNSHGFVMLLDGSNGRKYDLKGHCVSPSQMQFSADGKYLLLSSRDEQTLSVWDTASGRRLSFIQDLQTDSFTEFWISPINREMAIRTNDLEIRQFPSLQLIYRLKNPTNGTPPGVVFNGRGTIFAFESNDPDSFSDHHIPLILYDAHTGKKLWSSAKNVDHSDVAFSSDGRKVIACTSRPDGCYLGKVGERSQVTDWGLVPWERIQLQLLFNICSYDKHETNALASVNHNYYLDYRIKEGILRKTEGGSTLESTSSTNDVWINREHNYAIRHKESKYTVYSLPQCSSKFAITGEGRYWNFYSNKEILIVNKGSEGGSRPVEVWSLKKGKRLWTIPIPSYYEKETGSTLFSKDGSRILVLYSGKDKNKQGVWIFESITGKVLSRLPIRYPAMGDYPRIVSVDAGGKRIAIISGDTIAYWDADRGKPLYTISTSLADQEFGHDAEAVNGKLSDDQLLKIAKRRLNSYSD